MKLVQNLLTSLFSQLLTIHLLTIIPPPTPTTSFSLKNNNLLYIYYTLELKDFNKTLRVKLNSSVLKNRHHKNQFILKVTDVFFQFSFKKKVVLTLLILCNTNKQNFPIKDYSRIDQSVTCIYLNILNKLQNIFLCQARPWTQL